MNFAENWYTSSYWHKNNTGNVSEVWFKRYEKVLNDNDDRQTDQVHHIVPRIWLPWDENLIRFNLGKPWLIHKPTGKIYIIGCNTDCPVKNSFNWLSCTGNRRLLILLIFFSDTALVLLESFRRPSITILWEIVQYMRPISEIFFRN